MCHFVSHCIGNIASVIHVYMILALSTTHGVKGEQVRTDLKLVRASIYYFISICSRIHITTVL